MKNVIKISLATAVIMSVGSISAQAADNGISIFDNVKVKGEVRPRYEMVDEENTKANANALTNRLVLGVKADLFGTDWLSTYVEMTDVHTVNDNYNSTDNGAGNSIVADPEQKRVTQAYLDFNLNKTKLRVGRQMMNVDNLRFVGAVAWRQMPQTFDAYSLIDNTVKDLNLFASYVYQRNSIFAGSKNDGLKDTDSVFLNAKYKVSDKLTVTGYGYLIGSTHDTYGVALTGKVPVSENLKLNYRAEYAMQTDASMETASKGKPNADASYMNLELGMNMSGVLAGLNYEVLSGDGGGDETAFTTPYATAHKFNGWADKFLGTPGDGLVDANVMVGYKSKSFGVAKAIYHDFSSDVGSTDYGTELDLIYKSAIPGVKGLTGMLKYADFSSDNSGAALTGGDVDTQKFWAMLDYKFSN